MLRITTEKSAEASALKLEGRLAGAWVDELERVWSGVTAERIVNQLVVDLCGVVFVDAEGKKLLERMYQQGVRLKASGCLMSSLIEEIRRNYDRSR